MRSCKIKMEIKKISESYIKPSSPTSPHLKTYKISLLDQFLMYDSLSPLIFFYNVGCNQHYDLANDDHFVLKRSQSLKHFLSETLKHYYPLAGRIKDHLSVDCNDEGVYYVEARANITLSEYLSQPDNLISMYSLLPRQASSYEPSSPGAYVIMIQETTFLCGCIGISVFGSHMVMDGTSVVSFIRAWAAAVRDSGEEIIPPNLDGEAVFPQYNAFPTEATIAALSKPLLQPGKHAVRRFLFDALSISNLQAQASNSRVKNPTRVEAVSSFLSECISAILNARSGVDKPLAFEYSVNLCQKTTPPLPKSSFGNFITMARGLCSAKETKLTSIVCKVREAIRKINVDFVKNIQRDGGFSMLYQMITSSFTVSNGVNFITISSLCHFGLHEIDFGWGKPMWVALIDEPPNSTMYLNAIYLMDSRMRKGIEAWVFIDEEDLISLENYEKLLAYASINPSPLKPDLLVSHL